MPQDLFTLSWRFWLFWALAFLGFPIGGWLANVIVGPVTTTVMAGIAGAIAGAVLGVIQWFVLKGQIPVPFWWVIATSAGMAVGLAISVAFLGSETSGNVLLWRAAITGVSTGVAQWTLLRQKSPQTWIWIIVVTLGWVAGWFITRGAGIDLDLKWPVFGATGALAFQVLTGIAIYLIFRSTPGIK